MKDKQIKQLSKLHTTDNSPQRNKKSLFIYIATVIYSHRVLSPQSPPAGQTNLPSITSRRMVIGQTFLPPARVRQYLHLAAYHNILFKYHLLSLVLIVYICIPCLHQIAKKKKKKRKKKVSLTFSFFCFLLFIVHVSLKYPYIFV